MKLQHLEQAALAGLDSLDPTALQSPLGNPRWPDQCYSYALNTAQSYHPNTSQVDSELLNGLYRDSRWLVAAYAKSLTAYDGRLVTTLDHRLVVGHSATEMLRLGTVDDDYRAVFVHDSDVAEGCGTPSFTFVGDETNSSLRAQWNDLQERSLQKAPEAKGCPALKVPSYVDDTKTIAGHFLSRYMEVLGERTIAHSTRVSIGGLAVCAV